MNVNIFGKILNFIGYIKPSISYLKYLSQQPSWQAKDFFCCISYDEMSLSSLAQYDPTLESSIGPHRNVFMLTVRGLLSDWCVILYVMFDYSIDVNTYQEIISTLYEIGFIVKLSICDQGPKNMALINQLNITAEKPYSIHPSNDQIKVFFCFDFVHIFKNFSSHLRDDFCQLPDGDVFTVSVFQDILDARGPSELANANLFDQNDLNIEGN